MQCVYGNIEFDWAVSGSERLFQMKCVFCGYLVPLNII